MATTNRESDRFMLRLPDGMRERVKKGAEQQGRSMNAEIVDALLQRYPEAQDDFGLFIRLLGFRLDRYAKLTKPDMIDKEREDILRMFLVALDHFDPQRTVTKDGHFISTSGRYARSGGKGKQDD